jgi:1-acyl-sn-glycerol-3-phosphate acyltransferase
MNVLCAYARAILFHLLLYGWTAVYGIAAVPFLLAPRRFRLAIANFWDRGVIWLVTRVAGIRYEVRGTIPREPTIFAVKHQSAFETLALPLILGDPAFVLKRELFWIPLFGWYLASLGNIGIDRGAGSTALRAILARAGERLKAGQHVVIFPEGTRVAPGARRDYGPGVAALYTMLKLPVVPVALNSGLFWRRRSFTKTPGLVTVEFLPAIAPGLEREAFMAELRRRIDGATDRLLAEGRRQLAGK